MKKPEILIVEDEAVIAMGLQESLKTLGYKSTLLAATGEDALAMAVEHRPDLALMDIVLQGDMDGIETAEEIKRRCGIPVVYLTAYADEKIIERAKVTVPYGYLVKPVEERDLSIAVELALYRHRADRELEEKRKRDLVRLEQLVDERTSELRRALEEKDSYLHEIHHRVKNNMQVVSSLINIQIRKLDNEEAASKLKDIQNRLMALAFIHEQLYKSKKLTRIRLDRYIRSLASTLYGSYGISSDKILLTLDIDEEEAGIDTVIPLSLVVNELISNALKYAFPGGRDGEIRVGLHGETDEKANRKEYRLTVSDNGVGLPETVDMTSPETVSLTLVKELVEGQLEGVVELKRNEGTEFIITFRELDYHDRI